MTADRLGYHLADAQIDYDVIPADVFADRSSYHTEIRDGRLCVNTQQYRALLLPYMQFIPAEVANAARELQAAGVPVYVMDAMPEGICRGQADLPDLTVLPLKDLVKTLDARGIRDISLAPADNRIRYRRYLHDDGTEIILLVNEGTDAYEGCITLPDTEGKQIYAYDAWTNTLQRPVQTGNQVSFRLESLHSLTLVLDAAAEADDLAGIPAPATGKKEYSEIAFLAPWQRSFCRSIDYPAFGEEKEIALPDHLAEEEPKFSGFVRYRSCFEAKKDDRILLEITDAHEGVEVFVSGQSLGIQIVPPFCYELTGALSDGTNELTIEVATTLERENSGIPDVTGQVHEPTALSGITGQVHLKKVQ